MPTDMNDTPMDECDMAQIESGEYAGETALVAGSAGSDVVLERVRGGQRIFVPRRYVRLYRKAQKPRLLTQEVGI